DLEGVPAVLVVADLLAVPPLAAVRPLDRLDLSRGRLHRQDPTEPRGDVDPEEPVAFLARQRSPQGDGLDLLVGHRPGGRGRGQARDDHPGYPADEPVADTHAASRAPVV